MNETVRYYVKKKQLDNPHNEPTPMYSVSLSIHPSIGDTSLGVHSMRYLTEFDRLVMHNSERHPL